MTATHPTTFKLQADVTVAAVGATVGSNSVATGGGCPADGLIIKSNGITLDLNGFNIIGDGAVTRTVDSELLAGDAGVRVEGISGVTITDSKTTGSAWDAEIRGFDAGVYIANKVDPVSDAFVAVGSGNTVEKLHIRENIGSLESDYGEGVVVDDSSGNTVVDNKIVHNGPFAGVALYQDVDDATDNNVVGRSTSTGRSPANGGNWILDNDINSGPAGLPGFTSQDDGVRVEPSVTDTTVENNRVERSGLDGIAVFFGGPNDPTSGTVVKKNTVRDNGFHEYVGPLPTGCPTSTETCAPDAYPHARNGAQAPNSTAPGPFGYAQFGHRKGDGIRVFGPTAAQNATGNTIGGATSGTRGAGGSGDGNLVCGSAANGIRVDGGNKLLADLTTSGAMNVIQNNQAGAGTGGGTADAGVTCGNNNVENDVGVGRAAFDLQDGNAAANTTPIAIGAGRNACSSNTWTGNAYSTKHPTCIA